MADTLLLKKYPNRRLYDTEKSTYVTLSQVAAMIREGRQIEVRDVETKEDVTAFILTQIVFEEAKKKTTLLPLSLLYLIIRYGETVLSEFFDKYLEQTFNNYLTYKAAADEQFKNWLQLGMNLSDLTQQAMKDPLKSWAEVFSEEAPSPEKEEKEG
jgi:polyhydroxyalkanoate synthesis repressor PhaR